MSDENPDVLVVAEAMLDTAEGGEAERAPESPSGASVASETSKAVEDTADAADAADAAAADHTAAETAAVPSDTAEQQHDVVEQESGLAAQSTGSWTSDDGGSSDGQYEYEDGHHHHHQQQQQHDDEEGSRYDDSGSEDEARWPEPAAGAMQPHHSHARLVHHQLQSRHHHSRRARRNSWMQTALSVPDHGNPGLMRAWMAANCFFMAVAAIVAVSSELELRAPDDDFASLFEAAATGGSDSAAQPQLRLAFVSWSLYGVAMVSAAAIMGIACCGFCGLGILGSSAAYRRQEMVALSWVLLLQFGGLVLLGQILVVLGRTHVLVASCIYEPFGVGACPDAATSGLATWVNTTRLDCCIPHLPRHPECAWVSEAVSDSWCTNEHTFRRGALHKAQQRLTRLTIAATVLLLLQTLEVLGTASVLYYIRRSVAKRTTLFNGATNVLLIPSGALFMVIGVVSCGLGLYATLIQPGYFGVVPQHAAWLLVVAGALVVMASPLVCVGGWTLGYRHSRPLLLAFGALSMLALVAQGGAGAVLGARMVEVASCQTSSFGSVECADDMHILRRFVGATAHHCCGDAVNPSCAWASGALGGLTAGSPSACRGYNDSALATVTGAVPQALQANMFKAARDGLGTTLTVLAALGGAELVLLIAICIASSRTHDASLKAVRDAELRAFFERPSHRVIEVRSVRPASEASSRDSIHSSQEGEDGSDDDEDDDDSGEQHLNALQRGLDGEQTAGEEEGVAAEAATGATARRETVASDANPSIAVHSDEDEGGGSSDGGGGDSGDAASSHHDAHNDEVRPAQDITHTLPVREMGVSSQAMASVASPVAHDLWKPSWVGLREASSGGVPDVEVHEVETALVEPSMLPRRTLCDRYCFEPDTVVMVLNLPVILLAGGLWTYVTVVSRSFLEVIASSVSMRLASPALVLALALAVALLACGGSLVACIYSRKRRRHELAHFAARALGIRSPIVHEPGASETLTKTRGADDGSAVAVVPVLRGVHVRRGASFRRSNHDRRRNSSSDSLVTAAPGLDVGLLYYGLVLYQMLAWLVVLLTIAAVVAVALATVGPYTCRGSEAELRAVPGCNVIEASPTSSLAPAAPLDLWLNTTISVCCVNSTDTLAAHWALPASCGWAQGVLTNYTCSAGAASVVDNIMVVDVPSARNALLWGFVERTGIVCALAAVLVLAQILPLCSAYTLAGRWHSGTAMAQHVHKRRRCFCFCCCAPPRRRAAVRPLPVAARARGHKASAAVAPLPAPLLDVEDKATRAPSPAVLENPAVVVLSPASGAGAGAGAGAASVAEAASDDMAPAGAAVAVGEEKTFVQAMEWSSSDEEEEEGEGEGVVAK